jgi:protein SCO1/2
MLFASVARAPDGPRRYTLTGMVLEVHPSHERFVVSHESVPGAMEAMTMPFEVRDPKELDGVKPGARVTFTLVLETESAYAEQVRVLRYESAEQDPLTARRLRPLTELADGHTNPRRYRSVARCRTFR